MSTLQLLLRIEEPTTVRTNRIGGNLIATSKHLPGNLLRAAIAQRYLRLHGNVDDRFLHLFEHDLLFRAGLPARTSGRVVPTSSLWMKCKTNPGHPPVHRFAGVKEVDLDQVALELLGGKPTPQDYVKALADLMALHPRAHGCPFTDLDSHGPEDRCGGRLEACFGFSETDTNDLPGEEVTVRITQRGRTATLNGTAKDGSLFTDEAIEPGQEFLARIEGTETDIESLIDACQLDTDTFLFVGRARATGGVVAIERIDFDQRKAAVVTPTIFGLQAVSPLIVTDQFLRPSRMVQLAGCTQLDTLGRVDFIVVDGFDTVSGLPRLPEVAIAPGSLLFYVNVEDPVVDVSAGVGLRRNEGFGEVRIVPIHDPRVFP
jgi:hypothetical protein